MGAGTRGEHGLGATLPASPLVPCSGGAPGVEGQGLYSTPAPPSTGLGTGYAGLLPQRGLSAGVIVPSLTLVTAKSEHGQRREREAVQGEMRVWPDSQARRDRNPPAAWAGCARGTHRGQCVRRPRVTGGAGDGSPRRWRRDRGRVSTTGSSVEPPTLRSLWVGSGKGTRSFLGFRCPATWGWRWLARPRDPGAPPSTGASASRLWGLPRPPLVRDMLPGAEQLAQSLWGPRSLEGSLPGAPQKTSADPGGHDSVCS